MSEEILHGFTCEFVHKGDTCKLIDVLVDENRRLRDERDTCRDFVDTVVHPDLPAQLQAENAKLRDLARDMYERFYGVVIENWSYSTEDFQMYERRMRELGVEVSDE